MASTKLIKDNCKFQITDTREKIFSLDNNTWLVYSIGTIATNHVVSMLEPFSLDH